MRRILLFTAMIGLATNFLWSQNVAINTTGVAANASSMLDVNATDKGILIPRVVLSATNVAAPVAGPLTSLMVYNTATAGAGAFAVTPGYYYWDGTQWLRMLNTGNAWLTGGNFGTNVATNFAGTMDNMSFAIRTNNLERARITNGGQFVVNNTVPIAGDVFSAYAAGTNYAVNGYATGSGDAGYFQNTGTANAVTGVVTGTTGSAGQFTTMTGANNISTVDIYNQTGTAPAVIIRTDLANAGADGMEFDVNGAAAKRGIDMYVDVAVTGIGMAVFHDGTNRCLNVQQQNAANTQPAIFASVAGNARIINAQSTFATHTSQIGFFSQGSTGLVTATYGNAAAVWGQSSGIRGGVFLAAGASVNNTCLQGNYSGAAGNYDGIGVLGTFAPAALYGYGVVGQGNWYGVFANGDLGASGIKPFMIDHPLDPENKYLKHFALESDEVLNMYRGNVVLDANGEAVVELPGYFHAINIDFSYVLTPIGAPANMYVKTEIDATGKFTVAGGTAGMKVSWYVYAQRNDPYVQQNPEKLIVEFEKRDYDKGLYLQPGVYNQPIEKGIFYRYKAGDMQLTEDPAQMSNQREEKTVEIKK